MILLPLIAQRMNRGDALLKTISSLATFNPSPWVVFGIAILRVYPSANSSVTRVANKKRICYADPVDEGRKRVLLIAASILAARKLAQYDSGARVPATVSAIADAVRWAERIMEEIDQRHPVKPAYHEQPR